MSGAQNGKASGVAKSTPAPSPSTSKAKASDAPARRRFPVLWAVRIGGQTFRPGDKKGPALTSEEHEDLARTGAIATPWNEGESA